MNSSRPIIIAIILLLIASGIAVTDFSFHGKPEGIYLLKGTDRKLFALKDHLQLTEYERLIARVEFEAMYDRWRSKKDAAKGAPYLKYSWHKKTGGGYIINFFPDGTKFLACFGRAVDDKNRPVKGLFPGGGLPASHYETASLKTNRTGLVLYDGKEWHHLQQNADEAIFRPSNPAPGIKPGQWEYLGSRILFASQFRLALKSSHTADLGSDSVRIDRYLIYHAGDCYFTLANRLTNMGTAPLGYQYSCNEQSLPEATLSAADKRGTPLKRSVLLLPGRAVVIVQTIGMAPLVPGTAPPCEPSMKLDPDELGYFLSR